MSSWLGGRDHPRARCVHHEAPPRSTPRGARRPHRALARRELHDTQCHTCDRRRGSVVTQPHVDTSEVVRAKAPSAQPSAAQPSAAQPSPDPPRPTEPLPAEPTPDQSRPTESPPAEPIPSGSPLAITGKSHGLRFTTTSRVERTATALQLAIDVELHNSTRAPMKVSPHPPLVTISPRPRRAPPAKAWASGCAARASAPTCAPPVTAAPPRCRRAAAPPCSATWSSIRSPWPAGQAYRVTATSRDCRPSRLSLEVLDVIVVQPASPDGVPSLLAASPVARK